MEMEEGKNYHYLIPYHGWMMATAFGVVFPLGVLMPVVFKGTTYWPVAYQVHKAFNILGGIFMIVGLGLGAKLNLRQQIQYIHRAIGIAVFALVWAQILLTLSTRPVLHGKMRGLYNVLHWWGGRTAIVVGVGNAYYGMLISQPATRYFVGFSVAIGGILLIAVVGQVLIHALYYNYNYQGQVVLAPTAAPVTAAKGSKPSSLAYQHVVAEEPLANGTPARV